MALPKKKSRLIDVDGVKYRWMVGKISHRDGTAAIVVELPDKGKIGYCQKIETWNPDADWGNGGYEGTPVTPVMVRDFIRERTSGVREHIMVLTG